MTAESTAEGGSRDSEAATWRIEAAPPSVFGQVAAVWRYRRLFWPFTVRALFNVYRATILGILWMVIQPLALALPTAFILSNVFNVSVAPLPLSLFIMAGLACWTFFRVSVQWMTRSMGSSRAILKRVYVPALLLLAAAVSPAVFQFLVVLACAAALAIYFGPIEGVYYVEFSWRILALAPAVLMSFFLALGLSCFTSILNALARDTWLTMRFVLSAWMLATPVFYPLSIIPEEHRWIAYLNPMTPVIELCRWALLGYGAMEWRYLGLSAMVILVVLVSGVWFFARQQNRLFDHM